MYDQCSYCFKMYHVNTNTSYQNDAVYCQSYVVSSCWGGWGVRGKQNRGISRARGFWGKKKCFILHFWVAKTAKPWTWPILVQMQQGRMRMGGLFRWFLGVFQLFGGRTGPGGAGPQQALAAMAAAQAPPCSPCSSSLRPRPPHGFGLSWRCRGAIVILLCFISAALRGEEGSRRGCRCGCRGGAARVGAGLQPLARRDAGGAWHCHPCSDRCNMKRE